MPAGRARAIGNGGAASLAGSAPQTARSGFATARMASLPGVIEASHMPLLGGLVRCVVTYLTGDWAALS